MIFREDAALTGLGCLRGPRMRSKFCPQLGGGAHSSPQPSLGHPSSRFQDSWVKDYFRLKSRRLNPGGIIAISRWLSVSDTTGNNEIKTSHPQGVTECGRKKRTVPSGIPAGMRGFCGGMFRGCSGDVAALNPRLMALIPPGSDRFDPSGFHLSPFLAYKSRLNSKPANYRPPKSKLIQDRGGSISRHGEGAPFHMGPLSGN